MRVFDYTDYKKFIKDFIASKKNRGRGERKKISEKLNCQMSFVTHVLSGDKDFNHEQSLKLADHFCLSESETEYLLTLLSMNRAGTVELKRYYFEKLDTLRVKNENLKARLKGDSRLSLEDEVIYYSSWIHAAVHMSSTISELQDIEDLGKALKIDRGSLTDTIKQLEKMGLISVENQKIKPGSSHVYLGSRSPLISQMHTAWRNKIVNSYHDTNFEKNLHYTNCFSVSKKDFKQVREILVQCIARTLEIIRPSKEESLGVICLDLKKITE